MTFGFVLVSVYCASIILSPDSYCVVLQFLTSTSKFV